MKKTMSWTGIKMKQKVKDNPAYACFRGAKSRCENPNATSYKNYGAKGIKFLYKSFQDLLNDVGPRPSMEHTLERINSKGNYENGNVKWATWKEQANNRKKVLGKFGICGVHQKHNRDSFIAYSNDKALYIGKDFFEACCVRKSWELNNKNLG